MSLAATPKPELKAPIIAGFVASVSGSAATFGIAIAGLLAMGATREQTSTAIFVLLFGYGLLSTVLRYRYKIPISIVWSTPGAAFLAASAGVGLEFEQAVGGPWHPQGLVIEHCLQSLSPVVEAAEQC